jgi:thiamine biosynthesis lipoprotein
MKPDGNLWRIGIKDPYGNGNIGVLEISNRVVVSSGGYERYFTGEDGNRYGHIIDPSTGWPADNGVTSAVVVGESGKVCDALSTAFFVMGVEKSISFWRENAGFDFLLLTEKNELYITEGLEKDFTLNQSFNSMKVIVITL